MIEFPSSSLKKQLCVMEHSREVIQGHAPGRHLLRQKPGDGKLGGMAVDDADNEVVMVMETKQIIGSVNTGDCLAHLTATTTGPGKQGNKMVHGSKDTIYRSFSS